MIILYQWLASRFFELKKNTKTGRASVKKKVRISHKVSNLKILGKYNVW